MIEAPYFKQRYEYSCGPAVLRMLGSFYQKEVDPDFLLEATKATPSRGTSNEDLLEAVRQIGLNPIDKENASLEDIEEFIREGRPVVVNFIEPLYNEGHYSLVIGVEKDSLILNDPLLGKGHKISKTEFESRWKGEFSDKLRWLMVVEAKERLLVELASQM